MLFLNTVKSVHEMVLPSCPLPCPCLLLPPGSRRQLQRAALHRHAVQQDWKNPGEFQTSREALSSAPVGPTSMRSRDVTRQRSTHTAHMWTHTAQPCSDRLCPPSGKGFKAIPALRQHLQSQVGQESGNFSFPQSLSLVTKLLRHKNLVWSQYFYSLPEAVSRESHLWAPGASFQHQGEPCTRSQGAANSRSGPAARRCRSQLPLQPTALITGRRGADGRHIFRDTWQKRGVSSPGRGNCSPGSAAVITGEGAGACVQTPPHCDYRGLDRKLSLAGSSAERAADTRSAYSHGAQGHDSTALKSCWRLFRSSQTCQAGGICSLNTTLHLQPHLQLPAHSFHLHLQPRLTLCPLSPWLGPACGCWASPQHPRS